MRKFILLLILLGCFTSVMAQSKPTSCTESFFVYTATINGIPRGFTLDSIYELATVREKDSVRISKIYWTGIHQDSATIYKNGVVSKNVYTHTMEVSTEGDITTILTLQDGQSKKKLEYFNSEDSISYTETTFTTGFSPDIVNTEYLSLRNDSLFMSRSTVYPNPADKNSCYQVGTFTPKDTVKYEFEQTDNGFRFRYILKDAIGQTVVDNFLIPTADSTPVDSIPTGDNSLAIIRASNLPTDVRKFQYFDLVGRPARGKHSVQVPKTIR